MAQVNSIKAMLVLCNAPDSKTAQRISENIVRNGHAACVNILPACRSVYRWDGAIHDDAEVPLLIKTSRQCLDALIREIAALHPYDVPEIIAVNIADGLPDYLRWVEEQCQ